MKKTELVFRELLKGAEGNKAVFTQLELARALRCSLSTINNALQPLNKMGAIKVSRRSFSIINAKKILYYWASIRNVERDIIYGTRAEGKISDIEKSMPNNIVFAAYTAYKYRFKEAPADYSEVYVYAEDIKELMKRFPPSRKNPNLFVLKKDFADNEMPAAHIFADLWNIREWYASDFVKAAEKRIKWNTSMTW